MAANEPKKIPRRIAQTLVNALKGGVVPRVGLPYITVGRRSEIEALLSDVEMIEGGGASFRFIRTLRQRQELPAADDPQLCYGEELRRRGRRPLARTPPAGDARAGACDIS